MVYKDRAAEDVLEVVGDEEVVGEYVEKELIEEIIEELEIEVELEEEEDDSEEDDTMNDELVEGPGREGDGDEDEPVERLEDDVDEGRYIEGPDEDIDEDELANGTIEDVDDGELVDGANADVNEDEGAAEEANEDELVMLKGATVVEGKATPKLPIDTGSVPPKFREVNVEK